MTSAEGRREAHGQRVHFVEARQIRGHRDGAMAARFDFCRRGRELGLPAGDKYDIGAGGGEKACDSAPQAGARPGDRGDPAPERE